MLIASIIIFVITYICMFVFQKYRPYIALLSATIFVIVPLPLPAGPSIATTNPIFITSTFLFLIGLL